MHPKNLHNSPYNFKALIKSHLELSKYLFVNTHGNNTIDFSDNRAVLHLNKAILKKDYRLKEWNIPDGYLCPPIPGRADYIHHMADLLDPNDIRGKVKGLDIGVGANCIYPILGSQIYDWSMIGADIDKTAVLAAQNNIDLNPHLKENIEIRHQQNNAYIFEGIIKPNEYYHFSMCNPPFHSSEKEATKGTLRKLKNLSSIEAKNISKKLNFGGQANELWCNGGEALFIKRMIKQSTDYKTQVGWFTSLVSKKEHLSKIHKQLNRLKAEYKTIPMSQGSKQSRFIAWRFLKP